MWARVKKQTKDALLALFPSAYMIRLSALRPIHGEVSKDALGEDRVRRLSADPSAPAGGRPRRSDHHRGDRGVMIRVARQGAPMRFLTRGPSPA